MWCWAYSLTWEVSVENSGPVMFQCSYHTRDCFSVVEMEISPSVSQLPNCRLKGRGLKTHYSNDGSICTHKGRAKNIPPFSHASPYGPGRISSWIPAHFSGLLPLSLPIHHCCFHLPLTMHTKPRYLVNDQLALEDRQEVCWLLAHGHAHLHSFVPVLFVQLNGIEGTGSDFIHRSMATLGKKMQHATWWGEGCKALKSVTSCQSKALCTIKWKLKMTWFLHLIYFILLKPLGSHFQSFREKHAFQERKL